jgi:hypothetical protein
MARLYGRVWLYGRIRPLRFIRLATLAQMLILVRLIIFI